MLCLAGNLLFLGCIVIAIPYPETMGHMFFLGCALIIFVSLAYPITATVTIYRPTYYIRYNLNFKLQS